MMKQLHSESNRRPNSVRSSACFLISSTPNSATTSEQVFIDHFAGEVDARSGKPLSSHIRSGSNAGQQAEEEFAGYGFYGELSEVSQRRFSLIRALD